MEESKKIFLCGTAGFDNPGAWTKLMTESEVREYLPKAIEKAGWTGKSFQKLYVESHLEGRDSKYYVWGEEEPAFQGDGFGSHVGSKIVIDGKVVYNDLQPSPDSDPEDHEECEDCAH